MTIKATPALAYAAGTDAANRSMREGGRTAWNEQDYAEAVRVCNRILDSERSQE